MSGLKAEDEGRWCGICGKRVGSRFEDSCDCDPVRGVTFTRWKEALRSHPPGTMAVANERREDFEIGEPQFMGAFPLRKDVVVLPADPPKGCMRVRDERPEK